MVEINEAQDRLIFAEQLNYWLRIRGITQVQLACKVGVSESAVSFWCSGTKMPRIKTIDKIAEVLNISITDLLYEPDEVQLKQDELFDKKKVLFRTIEKVTEEDLDKINSIIEMIIGDKYDD